LITGPPAVLSNPSSGIDNENISGMMHDQKLVEYMLQSAIFGLFIVPRYLWLFMLHIGKPNTSPHLMSTTASFNVVKRTDLYVPLAEGVLLNDMQLQIDMLTPKLKAAHEACMVTLDRSDMQ